MLRSSALGPDEGVSQKARPGEPDPGVQRDSVGVLDLSLFSSFEFSRVQNIYRYIQ